MAKGKKRQKLLVGKRIAKENKMKSPGARSNYAKKQGFLARNGGFGFDYPAPKPWK